MQTPFKTDETTQEINDSDLKSQQVDIKKKISKQQSNVIYPRIGSNYQAEIRNSPINTQKCRRFCQNLKIWDGSSKKYMKLEVEMERKRLRYLMGREFNSEDTILTMFFINNFDRAKVNSALKIKKEELQSNNVL
ncbi:unnamed protein product [Paramecium octaurelia]|uniref:Uncharacterized protein n=1 Tax=Paramecium octaurelia TaxID=43137 RepID=A0A8S1XAZ4_PAROT|nr:unnamed protein product [Paramecium octaurelia]